MADDIKRRLRWLAAATMLLFLVLIGLGVWTYVNANQSREALCALRADLQQRVDSSVKFLTEHPGGIPGIPVKVIQDGIRNQTSTIRVLGGLSC